MDKLLYKLDTFEGPLDLLLTLIKKNKVSIYDIPIVEITEQYLEAIEGIEDDKIENTSEFLVMAANLLFIKSKMLLPKDEEEEEEDPREELARRLAEYQKFKEASSELRKTEFSSKYMVFREEEKINFPIPEYNREHTISELTDAFNSILQRKIRAEKPTKRAFLGIVGREKVSVDDMVEKICKRLKRGKRVQFKSLFRAEDSKPEMIATFLAVLEMIKMNRLFADYNYDTKDFVLTSKDEMNNAENPSVS
ncbi:MAG: segregation/condensation protein A [Oscillospiraceae bacterium]|nr:segregation/condensation protein A [Oscillospiraceae bacterium]